MEIKVEVDVNGPLFRHQYAEQIMAAYLEETTLKVAHVGKADVEATLHRVIRNPTPYYWTQIKVDTHFDGRVIHDSRVIYGRWLEGTGSRNYPVTRFRGYHTFRDVHARLEQKAPEIAGHVMHHYVRRLQ